MGITLINNQSITGTAVNVFDNPTGVGPYYIPFLPINTGSTPLYTDSTGLTYNATSNTITATTFSGTASFSTFATSASLLLVGANTANTNQNYVLFTPSYAGGGGTTPSIPSASSNFLFTPGTTELRAGFINAQSAGSKTSTADANLTIDASLTQSMTWIAAFTTTRSLIINNLTDGRQVNVWIRNTTAAIRQIAFSGSTATSPVPISMSVGGTGNASISVQNIAASTGTMFVNVRTIASTTFGTIT